MDTILESKALLGNLGYLFLGFSILIQISDIDTKIWGDSIYKPKRDGLILIPMKIGLRLYPKTERNQK